MAKNILITSGFIILFLILINLIQSSSIVSIYGIFILTSAIIFLLILFWIVPLLISVFYKKIIILFKHLKYTFTYAGIVLILTLLAINIKSTYCLSKSQIFQRHFSYQICNDLFSISSYGGLIFLAILTISTFITLYIALLVSEKWDNSNFNTQSWARYGNQSENAEYSTTPQTPAAKTPKKAP